MTGGDDNSIHRYVLSISDKFDLQFIADAVIVSGHAAAVTGVTGFGTSVWTTGADCRLSRWSLHTGGIEFSNSQLLPVHDVQDVDHIL